MKRRKKEITRKPERAGAKSKRINRGKRSMEGGKKSWKDVEAQRGGRKMWGERQDHGKYVGNNSQG